MSIISLSTQDFYLTGRRSRTLNIKLGGFVLVFFKMQECKWCGSFNKVFHQLAQQDKRVQYAVCDLTSNRQVAAMSKNTNSPIRTVPWIVFYADQIPIAKISGFKQLGSVKDFIGRGIQEATSRKQRQVFMPQQGNVYGDHQRPPPKQSKYYKPDMEQPSSMKNAIREGTKYAYLGDHEKSNDEKILIPENVTPHNKPWEGQYRKMSTFDY